MVAQNLCAILWNGHYPQGVWVCPFLGGTSKQNMVNKVTAIQAWAGPPGSGQEQWRNLIEADE